MEKSWSLLRFFFLLKHSINFLKVVMSRCLLADEITDTVLGNIFGDQFEWLWGLGPTSYFLYYNELVGFYSFEGVD